jgi:hypothetical protein
MVIAQIGENWLIEQVSDSEYCVHLGVLSFRMPEDDLLAFTGMFTTEAGQDMPDEPLCGICRLDEKWYVLTYRICTVKMCIGIMQRVSELCIEGYRRLQKMKEPGFKRSMDDIEEVLASIERKGGGESK